MRSLFPSIKEQKPGRDLYALIATVQFIICVFLIFFYTKMDADITNNMADAINYNQFSGQMVIALFLQILVMIIDRYLYKSKTFISVQQKELNKQQRERSMSRVAEDSKTEQSLERSNSEQDREKNLKQSQIS